MLRLSQDQLEEREFSDDEYNLSTKNFEPTNLENQSTLSTEPSISYQAARVPWYS